MRRLRKPTGHSTPVVVLILIALILSVVHIGWPVQPNRYPSFLKKVSIIGGNVQGLGSDNLYLGRPPSTANCFHGFWSDNGKHWTPSKECKLRRYGAEETANCFGQTHQRIIMVGDSIQRGIFWSLHDFFKGLKSEAGWNVTIDYRFERPRHGFTNFEDQDMVVSKDGKPFFSIRFVYASNAIHFFRRCELISDWFFQCLDSLKKILLKVYKEEITENRNGDSRKPVLFFNSGMWDWRTGLPASNYTQNMKKVFADTKHIYSSFSRVIWRTTTAAWPTRFMSSKECRLKPNRDVRPCKVHTGDIRDYNEGVIPEIVSMGFETIPGFEISSQRPDISYDGIHFKNGYKARFGYGWNRVTGRKRDSQIMYRVFSQFFFNKLFGGTVGGVRGTSRTHFD